MERERQKKRETDGQRGKGRAGEKGAHRRRVQLCQCGPVQDPVRTPSQGRRRRRDAASFPVQPLSLSLPLFVRIMYYNHLLRCSFQVRLRVDSIGWF